MPFIEAPTTFYLGRRFDASTHKLTDDVVYYDSRDLVTHAIVVGMTGSGKTGLCITMLEEAVLDNIPAIIIDPKGDITNLLLTFPDFNPKDFEPWVNPDDARRAGMDLPSYAADIAQRWKDSLASWGIVPDRLRWLKSIAKYSIYTPGSDAGLPVSILASLAAPKEGWVGHEEASREKINGIVTALLALIGKDVEPVKDKEHVLIANIFENAWMRGQNLTLEDVILQVQKPPFTKLGVLDIDAYMSEKDRFKLAMQLNNIVAAPSFQSWIYGEPLDIQNLLYQPNGRARVSVFYTAHLNEAERQFITTLLLENIQSWMQSQSGTTSLRALLYIDEMYGYFPPYPKNPPTKDPILRLLKSARAFGLGLLLATQNPGDLDYKGLSNAGTWFIGRLQSENDRSRVMAGLESLASAESQLNLKDVERLIADIEPRVFLMHNVHDNAGPVLVHSRWSMSYLRGPLTRQQVQILMAAQKQELLAKTGPRPAYAGIAAATPGSLPLPPLPSAQNAPPNPPGFSAQAAPPNPPGFTTQNVPPNPPGFTTQNMPINPPGYTSQAAPIITQSSQVIRPAAPAGFSANPPSLPSATALYFLPAVMNGPQALQAWEQQTHFSATNATQPILAYKPVLFAQASVRYQDKKTQLYSARIFAYEIPGLERTGLVHWEDYQANPIDTKQLSGEPFATCIYGDLSPGLTDVKRMASLKGELVDMLYNTAHLKIPYHDTLKIYGKPEAQESEFWAQVQQTAHENRDTEADTVAAKYQKQMDAVQEKIDAKERELNLEKSDLADRKREELFTQGEAVYGFFKGRLGHSLSRTSRASRMKRHTKGQLTESEQVIEQLEQKLDDLQKKFEAEIQATNDKWAKSATQAQTYTVTPYKKDIQVEIFGIGWLPHYYIEVNGQPLVLPVAP